MQGKGKINERRIRRASRSLVGQKGRGNDARPSPAFQNFGSGGPCWCVNVKSTDLQAFKACKDGDWGLDRDELERGVAEAVGFVSNQGRLDGH